MLSQPAGARFHRVPSARPARRLRRGLLDHPARTHAQRSGAARPHRLAAGSAPGRGCGGRGGRSRRGRRDDAELGGGAGARSDGQGRRRRWAEDIPALRPRRCRLGRQSRPPRHRRGLRRVLLHGRPRLLLTPRTRHRKALRHHRAAQGERRGPPEVLLVGRREAGAGPLRYPAGASRASRPQRTRRSHAIWASTSSTSRTTADASSTTAAAASTWCRRWWRRSRGGPRSWSTAGSCAAPTS